jgi:hypothetical protein
MYKGFCARLVCEAPAAETLPVRISAELRIEGEACMTARQINQDKAVGSGANWGRSAGKSAEGPTANYCNSEMRNNT